MRYVIVLLLSLIVLWGCKDDRLRRSEATLGTKGVVTRSMEIYDILSRGSVLITPGMEATILIPPDELEEILGKDSMEMIFGRNKDVLVAKITSRFESTIIAGGAVVDLAEFNRWYQRRKENLLSKKENTSPPLYL